MRLSILFSILIQMNLVLTYSFTLKNGISKLTYNNILKCSVYRQTTFDQSESTDDNQDDEYASSGRSYSVNSQSNNRIRSNDFRTNQRWGKPRDSEAAITKMKNEFDGDFLYGVNPILTCLRMNNRKIFELILQSGMDIDNKKDDKGSMKILELVKERNIPTKELSKHDLNMLTDSRPHQGFVLKASKLEFELIKCLPPTDKFKCVLALDEVWDPQNFGALIRTCHFLNIDQVVICAKNSAPPTPAVSKASAGALEATEIYAVQNLMKFLDESTKNGWQVVGTALNGKTIGLSSLPLDKPTIVVLGNEGHGVRTNILNRCHHLVKIGVGISSEVDSLNVSVTGGIILHHVAAAKNAAS